MMSKTERNWSEKQFDDPEKSQTIFSQEGTGWSFHSEKIIESCFWRQTGERPVGGPLLGGSLTLM